MSQIFDKAPVVQDESQKYIVNVSYYAPQVTDKGVSERLCENAPIQLWKISRRNRAHSKFIMDFAAAGKDISDLAIDFVSIFCADDMIKNDLVGDCLACVEILQTKEVQEEIAGFFEKWDFIKKIPGSKA